MAEALAPEVELGSCRSISYCCHLFGAVEVSKPLMHSTDTKRGDVAETCLDFAVRALASNTAQTPWSPANPSFLTLPRTRPGQGRTSKSGRAQSPSPKVTDENDSCLAMIPVYGESWISSRSPLQYVPVEVNLSGNSIVLTQGCGLICQHPFKQLSIIVAPNPSNKMVIYIGRDLCRNLRIAVVLQMASTSVAQDLVRDYHRLNDRSRKLSTSASDSTDDSPRSISSSLWADSLRSASPLLTSASPLAKEKKMKYIFSFEELPSSFTSNPLPTPITRMFTSLPREHLYETIYPLNSETSEEEFTSGSEKVPKYDLTPALPLAKIKKYSDFQLYNSTSSSRIISSGHSADSLPLMQKNPSIPSHKTQSSKTGSEDNLSSASCLTDWKPDKNNICKRQNSTAKLMQILGPESREVVTKTQDIATPTLRTSVDEQSIRLQRQAEIYKHIDHFLSEEFKYFRSLQNLIYIVRNSTDIPKIKQSCTHLESLASIHKELNASLSKNHQTPPQIAQVFLRVQDTFGHYVDFIRAYSSTKGMGIKLQDDQIKEIKNQIQVARMRPHYYSKTFTSWLTLTDIEDEREVLRVAVNAMDMISRKADSYQLIDNIRKSPFPLSDLGQVVLYSEVTVSGTGFRTDQHFTVVLFNDVILFTLFNGNDCYKCFEALRMEYLLYVRNPAEGQDTVEVTVDYGERRGRETLIIKFATQLDAHKWNKYITRILGVNAMKIKRMNS